MRLVLVGNFSPGHVGSSLGSAAIQLGLEYRLCDSNQAFAGPRWLVRLVWHLLNRRPLRLRGFSERVTATCKEFSPDVILTTGCAPVDAQALREIGALGVQRVNYSTDDPWSRVHRSKWLLAALKEYDVVFSPRRSNLEQLRALNGPIAQYLPFAFDPALHFPTDVERREQPDLAVDVLFVGGADPDRVQVISELVRQGLDVALYGGYWERYADTRRASRGIAAPETISLATWAAKVSVCLVRKSNRDGHVMRSFEAAALGACMLVEDTEEHREIFGEEGVAVLYFRTSHEMTAKLKYLLSNPELRASLSEASNSRVATEANTYSARLVRMLEVAGTDNSLLHR